MNNLIECDSCNKHITSSQVQLKDTTFKPGKQKRTWRCPHCKMDNLIIVMDKKSRRMMKENKRDRERIGSINRKSQLLRKQDKFTSEQAQNALKQMEVIEGRINERTENLDEYTKRLMNEHKETL